MKYVWKRGVKCAIRSVMDSIECRKLAVYQVILSTRRSIGLHSATCQICYGIPPEKQLLYELRVAQGHFAGEDLLNQATLHISRNLLLQSRITRNNCPCSSPSWDIIQLFSRYLSYAYTMSPSASLQIQSYSDLSSVKGIATTGLSPSKEYRRNP